MLKVIKATIPPFSQRILSACLENFDCVGIFHTSAIGHQTRYAALSGALRYARSSKEPFLQSFAR